VVDRRPGTPDQRTPVGRGLGLGRVALIDHLPDEGRVLRLDPPVEGLGPPVGHRVRVGAVDHDLKVVWHARTIAAGRDRLRYS